MSIWDFTGSLNVLSITGNPMFDYFFTLVSFIGVIGLFISMIVKVITRS
jgi:hypothetical protein